MHNPNPPLPNGWSLKKLGEIGTFSKGAGITKDELVENGIPCIRYGELYTIHDFVIREYKSFISRELAKQSKRISKNDILMAGSGETLEDIGKAAAFIDEEEVYAGGDIIIFTPEEHINSICLSYLLNSGVVAKQRSTLGQGNSVVHIYAKDLSKLEIPLPPLPEQQKIAAILGTWDAAIQTTTALLAALQKRKKALMQQLLSPKTDWKEVRLGEIGSFSKGSGITKEELIENGIPCIRYGEIYTVHHFVIRKYHSFISDQTASSSKQIKQNDILFAGSGETLEDIGKAVAFIGTDEVYAGGDLIIFSPQSGDSIFFSYIINSAFVRKQIRSFGQGQSVVHLYSRDIEKLKIHLPPFIEQTRIAAILNAADAELRQTEAYLEKLKTQKRGLMQQLLTGKVRVNQHNGL